MNKDAAQRMQVLASIKEPPDIANITSRKPQYKFMRFMLRTANKIAAYARSKAQFEHGGLLHQNPSFNDLMCMYRLPPKANLREYNISPIKYERPFQYTWYKVFVYFSDLSHRLYIWLSKRTNAFSLDEDTIKSILEKTKGFDSPSYIGNIVNCCDDIALPPEETQ